MQMTQEQQKFAEENHNLIYFFLRRRQLSSEDYYGIAADGYCRAVMTFDPDRGKFSTYAMACMQRAILREWQTRTRKSVIKPDCLIYYDAAISKDEDKDSYMDHLEDPYASCEDNAIVTILCRNAIKEMSEKEREIIRLIHLGHTQKRIAELFQISPCTVSHIKRRFIRKLVEEA